MVRQNPPIDESSFDLESGDLAQKAGAGALAGCLP
jgi:hypothetical protein